MKNEIFVRASSDNKIYKTNTTSLDLTESDEVLFETDQGQEVGVLVSTYAKDESSTGDDEVVSITRKLTKKDKEICAQRKSEAMETLPVCREKIKKHALSMDLLNADISYDGKKLTFYFSAPGRIDFRSLVPDLASTFKKLIRLQQVSSRDKARCMNGVVGRCGRRVCCRDFLKNGFEDITVDMASVQNIGQTGSNRVTGACGKLMCCLKFELEMYKKAQKSMPEVGSQYKTKEGTGRVIACNIVKSKISVELNSNKKIVEVDC